MSSILAEPASEVTSGFSRGGNIDLSGEYLHLSPKERKRAKLRARARAEKWKRAAEIRAGWTQEQHDAEARLIAEQIAEWELRDAA